MVVEFFCGGVLGSRNQCWVLPKPPKWEESGGNQFGLSFFLKGDSYGGAGERDAITSPSAIDPVSQVAGTRVFDHPAINSVCGVGHLGSLCFLYPAPLQCAL